MESVTCIICNSDSNTPFLQVPDRFGDENFLIVKCVCGFKYLSPRPRSDEMSFYYDNDTYDPHKSDKETFFDKVYSIIQEKAFKWKYSHISKFTDSGHLLDIGGGSGQFCLYSKSMKWQVALQDNSRKARETAKEENISTYSSLFAIKNNKFDLITMWHSLEHIHDIEELFFHIDRLINDDGILVIAIPNINAPERRYFRENWVPWDAPRHLYHFNYAHLSKLLLRYGWVIQCSKTMIQDTPYNIMLSLKSKSFIQILYGIIILIYSIFRIAIGGINSSSSFMVICKKK